MIPQGAWVIFRYDDRLLSPCHGAAVTAVMGALEGAGTANWSQRIDHYCTSCEAKVDPKECAPGPGTEFAKLTATEPERT